jgi:hypothetical protein
MAPQQNEDLTESMQAFENSIDCYANTILSQFLLRLLRNGRISPYNLLAATQTALEDFNLPMPIARMLDQVQSEIGNMSSQSNESNEDGE